MEHSTILYESPSLTPLTRIYWNKFDPNLIATLEDASNIAYLIDVR